MIFTRNTTDALNLLAHIAPWVRRWWCSKASTTRRCCRGSAGDRTVRLPLPLTPQAAVLAADAALAAAPTGPRLLVVTAASNVTGELWPVAELARAARANGARIAVDVAQLDPHRPVSMTELDVDYVAFSGHKLYAPYGAGCLVGRADWARAAQPYLYGGGATAAVGSQGVSWAADPAQRHEAGTPNVAGAVAIAAASEALSSREALVAEEERLLGRLRDGLAALPGVTQLSIWGPWQPRVGIVAFTLDGWEAGAVARTLSEDYGIGVRDGRFCAHLLVDRLAGRGGAAVRASIGLGTVDEHVDRLLSALAALSGRPGSRLCAASGPAATSWSAPVLPGRPPPARPPHPPLRSRPSQQGRPRHPGPARRRPGCLINGETPFIVERKPSPRVRNFPDAQSFPVNGHSAGQRPLLLLQRCRERGKGRLARPLSAREPRGRGAVACRGGFSRYDPRERPRTLRWSPCYI